LPGHLAPRQGELLGLLVEVVFSPLGHVPSGGVIASSARCCLALVARLVGVIPPQTASTSPSNCTSRRLAAALEEDADCGICSRLLYEPVTTPCG
jgi:hypothetical protein